MFVLLCEGVSGEAKSRREDPPQIWVGGTSLGESGSGLDENREGSKLSTSIPLLLPDCRYERLAPPWLQQLVQISTHCKVAIAIKGRPGHEWFVGTYVSFFFFVANMYYK